MVAFKALPALGLLALLVASTTALSTQEIAGLQAMMASMPGLTSPFGIMHWSNSDIGNACNWRGITCKENSIVTLTVRDYMGGSLPDAIGGFVNMTSFSLLKSGCTGTIPRSINKWTKLHDFWIDTSEITGNLPDILSFPRLNSFYVQRCKINGQLPPEWAKHQSLVWLYLNGNEISGSIPESWNSWSKLVYLQLNENKLTGPVPSFIGSPNIYTVWLQKNMLSGTLPAQWGPVVGDLSLGNNQLVGTIPQWNLQTNTPYRIDLSINQLVGTIPDIFGPSEYWRYIDLQNNRLTGTLPNSIGSMNQLRGLYVQGNMLTLCPAPNPFQLTTQFGDSYCDVSGQIGVNNCACASVYASQTCKVSAC